MANQQRLKMCFEILFIGLRYLRFLTILGTIINRGLFVLSLNYQRLFFKNVSVYSLWLTTRKKPQLQYKCIPACLCWGSRAVLIGAQFEGSGYFLPSFPSIPFTLQLKPNKYKSSRVSGQEPFQESMNCFRASFRISAGKHHQRKSRRFLCW